MRVSALPGSSPPQASAQLALGEIERAEPPPRWRRCLSITAPIDIAARTAIAIKIGTSGEEPLPLFLLATVFEA